MPSRSEDDPHYTGETVLPAQDDYDLLIKHKYVAIWFSLRYEKKRRLRDLDHATSVFRHAVDVTSPSNPIRITFLSGIIGMLSQRFSITRSIVDINDLVDAVSLKVDATPSDDPDRAARLTDYATVLQQRYGLTRSTDDLHKAVNLGSLAIEAVPEGHHLRAILFDSYAKTLAVRSSAIESSHDLDDAIKVSSQAIELAKNESEKNSCCQTHAILLQRRFAQTGTRQYINAAIQMAEITANAVHANSPHRLFYQSSLAKLLQIRFGEIGSLNDLDRAIVILEDVVKSAPQHDPNRLDNMTSLCTSLGQRFFQTEALSDINRAISLSSSIVESTAESDPYYARHLANLGNLAGTRYELTGLIDDLDLAIDALDKAVKLSAHLQPHTALSVDMDSNEGGLWISLGAWLAQRYERTDNEEDLNRSIEFSRTAVAKTPLKDHINQALHAYHLGKRLRARYELIGREEDIIEALELARTAVKHTPDDHPWKSSHLIGLGEVLFARYDRQESERDIEEAISLGLQAKELIDQNSPGGALVLAALGRYFGHRFHKTSNRSHLDNALFYFSQGVSCEASSPISRVDSARHAARILADQSKWEEASSMLRTVVELLPRVSPRMLNNSDKQQRLKLFSGLASFAAATSLQAGEDDFSALELLEMGRGLIGNSLLELRTDISELREKYPDIAERFETLRDELDSRQTQKHLQKNGLSFDKLQGNRLIEADEELSNLIVGIRDYPGFERFLLPPTREDFLRAAEKGPIVIINMNYYRCDAFLIQQDKISTLPLANLTEEEINQRGSGKARKVSVRSVETLEWLWTAAVEPILTALGYQHAPKTDDWPQVWWIPTGPLNHFPIHAAGLHIKGNSTSTLDRVMSSYTTSVKSLIAGRNNTLQSAARPNSGHALLVAMRVTPSLGASSILVNADREIEMLTKLCPSLHLKAVIPSSRQKDEIIQSLRDCLIFHFAGHGKVDNLDPAKSLLLLDDWKTQPLTVGDLRDMNMHESGPFLGFLSACFTSANNEITLVDEAVHLAGSLQLAGFRHVIGTLWEVKDSHCVEAAQIVYETIRDEGMTDTAKDAKRLLKAAWRI
ncbi:CHAT domain-containing protein [Boeremia exigua]|uniref:CHAT domain-containing protein n=1 Tax=Boeremia exigua TaxID=749465 RepID=UPI001E8D55FC|nr:CHAT domain-containing protein [Boeremia exigua]KAH6616261.1 CHAT domain-containing protein [Boeremia exigua]